MTTYDKICRICSSPANYDVFAKIPTYLHTNSHEFLNWQKPINILLEETTGLKVSLDDGLPQSICALCISYLKHAATFREQAITNALTLKAVQLLQQQSQKSNNKTNAQNNQQWSDGDKECQLITAEQLSYAEEREVDANLLANNCQQDHNKVRKQLLNTTFQSNAPTQQNVERQMRYLNLLFGKDANSGLRGKRSNNSAAGATYEMLSLGGDAEEEFQTTSTVSSDENEDADADKTKYNMFSYKEKNFEEDDIMDMDELREAITINIPESCKERKCRACSRRFMFDSSYREHMDTCIEYKFLAYIEEINRLLEIRRSKAISPHEFIRRMIFCLRKTCDWLKANCGDMLLPDLLASGGETAVASEALLSESQMPDKTIEQRSNILLATPTTESITKDNDLNQEGSIKSLFMLPKTLKSNAATPISINNNILYEIERSQSRNSNQQTQKKMDFISDGFELKRPIAVFATSTTTTTTATLTRTMRNNNSDHAASNAKKCNEERLTFLQKLQKAGWQTPPPNKSTYQDTLPATPSTPLITVRRDLLHSPSPLQEVKPAESTKIANTATTFSARCNPCNILFETLASLELHNALSHNSMSAAQQPPRPITSDANVVAESNEAEQQRKRIIALFDDDEV